jgi:hypothetical protein
MKLKSRGKTHTSVLSRLGFHRVKTLRFKKGLFKADSEMRRSKNKGMRYFSHESGFLVALRTNGAWRLCDKKRIRCGRGHNPYTLEIVLSAFGEVC